MKRKFKLGMYQHGESLIHNLDPRTKLIGYFIIVCICLLNNHIEIAATNAVFVIITIFLSEVDIKNIFHGIKRLGILFIFAFTFQIIFTDGHPLIHIGRIIITQEGLIKGGTNFLRLLVLYISSMILTMTTSPMKMTSGMESLFSPLSYIKVPVHQFAMLITISLRFIPTIMQEAEIIKRAQISRGAPFNSPKKSIRIKTGLTILIPLIAGAMQRAGDLARAMESRCYTGNEKRSNLRKLRYKGIDYAALTTMIMLYSISLLIFL